MKLISNEDVISLNISPTDCVKWVREAFLMKSECQLPAKMSVHPTGNDFFTTMPCLLPKQIGRFGSKVVSRIVELLAFTGLGTPKVIGIMENKLIIHDFQPLGTLASAFQDQCVKTCPLQICSRMVAE